MGQLTAYQLKKKRCKLGIFLLFGFVMLCVTIAAYANWRAQTSRFADILSNFEHVPVTNVTFVSGETCPAEFELFKFEDFPGTPAFCNCPTSGNSEPTFTGPQDDVAGSAVCFANQTSAGCTPITTPIPSKTLLFNGRNVCVRRMGGASSSTEPENKNNAIKRPEPHDDGGCGAGYKECAPTTKVASATYVCTPVGEPCPITKLARVVGVAAKANYDECIDGPSDSLCWSREFGVRPIVEQKGWLNQACLPGDFSLSERPANDQRRGKRRSCVGGTDLRYLVLAESKQRPLYVAASVDSVITTWLSGQPTYDYTEKLFVRREIPWAKDCPRPRSDVANNASDVDRLLGAQTALLVISIIALIGEGLNVRYEWKQTDAEGWEDDTPQQMRVRRCRIVFVIISQICKIIATAVALGLSVSLSSVFADLKDAQCVSGDVIAQNAVNFFADETAKQTTLNAVIIVFVILMILMDLRDCYRSVKEARTDYGHEIGDLHVTVEQVKELRDTERMGDQDPYVRVIIEQRLFKSSVKKNAGAHAEYHEHFLFNLDGTERRLEVEVWNKNAAADKIIAKMAIRMGDLRAHLGTEWHELMHPTKSDTAAGQVLLTLRLVRQGSEVPREGPGGTEMTSSVAPQAQPVYGGGDDDDGDEEE